MMVRAAALAVQRWCRDDVQDPAPPIGQPRRPELGAVTPAARAASPSTRSRRGSAGRVAGRETARQRLDRQANRDARCRGHLRWRRLRQTATSWKRCSGQARSPEVDEVQDPAPPIAQPRRPELRAVTPPHAPRVRRLGRGGALRVVPRGLPRQRRCRSAPASAGPSISLRRLRRPFRHQSLDDVRGDIWFAGECLYSTEYIGQQCFDFSSCQPMEALATPEER